MIFKRLIVGENFIVKTDDGIYEFEKGDIIEVHSKNKENYFSEGKSRRLYEEIGVPLETKRKLFRERVKRLILRNKNRRRLNEAIKPYKVRTRLSEYARGD